MGLFSKEKRATATIRRIWHRPPPGAPWYYGTYVLFESRNERIQVKLSKRQAKHFVMKYSEGETGHLVYAGHTLVSWETASEQKPIRAQADVNVFLSYAHEWSDDAIYISQVFKSHGLRVWIDEGQLRTGDKLSASLREAIRSAHCFVALLSPEYFASTWCMNELTEAAQAGITVMPIKVSEGNLALPPHVRSLYKGALGEPLFLDIRKRDPSLKLATLAEQMLRMNKAHTGRVTAPPPTFPVPPPSSGHCLVTDELSQILRFTPEELDMNRHGKLSERQRRPFWIKGMVCLVTLYIATIVALGWLFLSNSGTADDILKSVDSPYIILGGITVVVVGTLVCYGMMHPKVNTVTGPITLPGRIFRRSSARVGKLELPPEIVRQAKRLQKLHPGSFHVHFVGTEESPNGTVLSMEPCDG